MKLVLVDTNVLLDGFKINDKYTYILLSGVNRELERHKSSGNESLRYNSRKAIKFIEDNIQHFKFDVKDYKVTFDSNLDDSYVDNQIMQACLENKYALLTKDLLLKHKAAMYGIEIVDLDDYDDYCGYKEVTLNDQGLADLYENLNKNKYSLLVNEYLIIKDATNNAIDCLKWNGEKLVQCMEKNLSTVLLGKFKPMDIYQKAAIDSLITNDVTLLRGKAGSGKSQVALNYALYLLEKAKINKLIIFANPVLTRGSQGLGFYKGDKNQKLLQSQIGNLLISKIGDPFKVETMVASGEILLIPFSDIRGFDTGEGNLVWISEAQNLDVSLMKLALQRLAKGSKMIIDGDDKAQVDNDVFAGSNNGIRRMSKIFRGEDLYGEIEFKTIYRSRVASIADKM